MTVEALAKVNLTLEVFGKRPDGFHALRSVVLPIGLSDTLTFTPADVFSTDTGYPDDLILKACRALASSLAPESSASSPRAYRISVTKRIPSGGGLGGGSADAAATLLALNELWGLGRTPGELAAVGAQVGSDVPALVLANRYRVPVLMRGRGEVVELLSPDVGRPAPDMGFSLVLANPGVPCSTAEVYKKCRSRVTDDANIVYTMRSALESRDAVRVAAAMMNDLQEPAVAICPEVAAALAALGEVGVGGAMMSGSGSTVFGLVSSEVRGREIVALLNDHGLRAWSVAACPVV